MMKKRILKLMLILPLVLLFYRCSHKEKTAPAVHNKVWLQDDNYTFSTYQRATLTAAPEDLSNAQYKGSFAGEEVTLKKTSDSTLTFFIPEVPAGKQTLKFDLGEVKFDVIHTKAPDPDEMIQDMTTHFEEKMANIPATADIDWEGITRFKEEVLALYSQLTIEEKKMTAAYYEANKASFHDFVQVAQHTMDAPIDIARQSECPKTDYKLYYSCTASNIATSLKSLTRSAVEAAVMYGSAGTLLAASPFSFGLTAVGGALALGMATYILTVEILPEFIRLAEQVKNFAVAHWILAKATFVVLRDRFTSQKKESLGVQPVFRTVRADDKDVSEEVSTFLVAYNNCKDKAGNWLSKFAEFPAFTDDTKEEPLNTAELTIKNISNENVTLDYQDKGIVTFKSTSGEEEHFTFDVIVKKEGFTRDTTVEAVVSAAEQDIVISSVQPYCAAATATGITISVGYDDRAGNFDFTGSYSGTDPEDYPVRLEFQFSYGWDVAYNAYTVKNNQLPDGKGMALIKLELGETLSCSESDYFNKHVSNTQWRVALKNGTGGTQYYPVRFYYYVHE